MFRFHRTARKYRRVFVATVAERMGADPAQVSRFETGGTNPTMSTIRRYAKAVGALVTIRVERCEQAAATPRTVGATGTVGAAPR
ncbi:helix-turn-helix transcriptional regulator [Gordonia sp. CPCC 205515]|uniref:helix-turn-helix domain-containing protein n=1 Tax=Gordonia sp. CPCC 205515 TaxID=3140791 RepID=UPI003AF3C0BA